MSKMIGKMFVRNDGCLQCQVTEVSELPDATWIVVQDHNNATWALPACQFFSEYTEFVA